MQSCLPIRISHMLLRVFPTLRHLWACLLRKHADTVSSLPSASGWVVGDLDSSPISPPSTCDLDHDIQLTGASILFLKLKFALYLKGSSGSKSIVSSTVMY